MTREPIATSQGKVAPLQEDAYAITWVAACHERVRVRANVAQGPDREYEFVISGGTYFIRRMTYANGTCVEHLETTPTALAAAEQLWADLVNGRAL